MPPNAALDGLRVVEVGDFIAAPYAAKLLADLGAEVLKVEPIAGDRARRYGPFRGDVPDPEASGLFIYLNTNKRGVTLDVTTPTGRELLRRLLDGADVLVENLEPGLLELAGLDYDSLAASHPQLVVTSISPYGRRGPHARWRGGGLQASAGSTVAHRTGDPERAPLGKPLLEEEFLGGVHAAGATLMAVLFQEDGGGGQHVDISLQDILASTTSGSAVAAAMYGARAPATRAGHRVNAFYPWTVLPVADGFMEIVTLQRRHWDAFIEEIGSPAWAADPRFQNLAVATALGYADELDANLLAAIGHRTRADLWEVSRRRMIPFHPVHRIDEIVDSDQFTERGYFVEAADGNGHPVKMPGAPYQLSETPWAIRAPAPRLGQHNEDVFGRELGVDGVEMTRLRRAGAI